MTSNDTLLPCPFCGGEARISRAHQNKMLAMGEVPTDEHYLFTLYHDCANGITICWTYKPKDALIAAWNRRTTPTPATEEREAVARAICYADGTENCHCKGSCQDDDRPRVFYEYADAALSALAQIRAAEILAAEANERARIATFLRYKAAKYRKSRDEAQDIAVREHCDSSYLAHTIAADAIERNEHGAGK